MAADVDVDQCVSMAPAFEDWHAASWGNTVGSTRRMPRYICLANVQPAGLWAADLGVGPVAALALGMHLVPPNQRRSVSGSSGGSGGETR